MPRLPSLILALALVVVAHGARADAFSSVAPFSAQRSLNTITAATAHDEKIGTDGIVSVGSAAFSSASAAFSPLDVGKTIIINGAGASGADLQTTIAGYTDANHITLAAPATYATPWWGIGRTNLYSGATMTASYAVGDILTVSGGTASQAAQVTVVSLGANSPSVASGGSGGANGACTVMGTTGTTRTTWNGNYAASAGYFTVTGTVVGGVLTGPLTIQHDGDYSTAPSNTNAEPVVPISGCVGLTGATVKIYMAPHALQTTTQGHYTSLPTAPIAITGGSGSGATLSLWSYIYPNGDPMGGYYAYGTDDTAAINAAIVQAQAVNGGTVVLPAGRHLVLNDIIIPYTGTTPPVQPALRMTGAGNISIQTKTGGYNSLYSAGTVGTILDLRGTGNGGTHVAKIDTRGQGKLELDHLTFSDWGTDNFLFLQTTNTTLNVHDTTWVGNPTCFEMTCQQNALRFGSIQAATGPLSTNDPNAGYQGYQSSVENNVFGYVQEGIQLGSAANGNYFANNEADDTTGSYSTGSGFITIYGAGLGASSNNFVANTMELKGYPYTVVSKVIGSHFNAYNSFIANMSQDGTQTSGLNNGNPTVGAYYFDASSNFNSVFAGYIEDDIKQSYVIQAGTAQNKIIRGDALPDFNFGGFNTMGKVGIGTASPTWPLDIGSGSGAQIVRLNGANSGTSGGSCYTIANASSTIAYFGNASACTGGSYSNHPIVNGVGFLDLEVYGTPYISLANTGTPQLLLKIPASLPSYTVATLPTCGTSYKGAMAYVTDASSPTYNGSLTGGSTTIVPVFCNGSAWTAH